jgi:adenylyltransferase/sulfurtransferase
MCYESEHKERKPAITQRKTDAPRYKQQLALAGMSATAQEKLFHGQVVILGLGGLGCACAAYLAEAGVGSLVLVDPSELQEAELNEHILLRETDVGITKVEAAKKHLQELNPAINIHPHHERFSTHNAERLARSGEIIVDAMGNWQDKLSASDICMQLGKTLVHAGIRAFEFQIYTMIPGKSACLRCMFADTGIEDIVSAARGPKAVLGPLAGVAGSFQAVEVIKLICGLGATPGSNLIKFDALRRYVQQVTELSPRPGCPDCDRRF